MQSPYREIPGTYRKWRWRGWKYYWRDGVVWAIFGPPLIVAALTAACGVVIMWATGSIWLAQHGFVWLTGVWATFPGIVVLGHMWIASIKKAIKAKRQREEEMREEERRA